METWCKCVGKKIGGVLFRHFCQPNFLQPHLPHPGVCLAVCSNHPPQAREAPQRHNVTPPAMLLKFSPGVSFSSPGWCGARNSALHVTSGVAYFGRVGAGDGGGPAEDGRKQTKTPEKDASSKHFSAEEARMDLHLQENCFHCANASQYGF